MSGQGNQRAFGVPMPRRILLIRLSALGDVVMATSVLPALRKAHPQAEITWMIDAGWADLIRGHPRMDHILEWPRRSWQRSWREGRRGEVLRAMWDFRRRLRAARFDWAVDLQGLAKSGLWAWASGAPFRVSLGGREGSGRLMHRVVSRQSRDKQIANEYRLLCEALDWDVTDFALDLAVTGSALASVRERCRREGIRPGPVVFAPFTTRPQKHWVDSHWPALGRLVLERTERDLILLGAADPEGRPSAWARELGARCHDWTGTTGLMEASATIHEASALVGVDTGLTHMGVAHRVPTVALFGSTRPYLHAPRAPLRVLWEPLECSPCRRHPTCNGAFTCMRLHEPESVFRTLAGLVDAHTGKAA